MRSDFLEGIKILEIYRYRCYRLPLEDRRGLTQRHKLDLTREHSQNFRIRAKILLRKQFQFDQVILNTLKHLVLCNHTMHNLCAMDKVQ